VQKIIVAALCLVAAALAPAQALPEPIAQEFIINDVEFDEVAERRVAELLNDRKLVSLPEFFKSLPANRPAIPLPKPGDTVLDAPEIADQLLASTLAIGTTSYCKDCEAWHVYLSSGFVVADGGVAATSLHIFQDIEEAIDQTYPIAVDATGRVYPITTLLAADTAADSCLIQLDGAEHLAVLPLELTARTGELVYLMSHPDGRYFRFSEGIIARLVGSEVENRTLRFLDVTAEFAPGSSGGPLVNRHGAVVGHVSTIAAVPLADDGTDADGSAVVERLCTSSSAIAALAEPGVNRRVPMKSPSE
jgi:S1-C subfamily serine protease